MNRQQFVVMTDDQAEAMRRHKQVESIAVTLRRNCIAAGIRLPDHLTVEWPDGHETSVQITLLPDRPQPRPV